MDGVEVHADDCPVRGPEILAESEKLRAEAQARDAYIGTLEGKVQRLELQIDELKGALDDSEKEHDSLQNKIRETDRLNGEFRKALERIDAMRKRLPDPDFNEQRNTAAGIAEIIQVALLEKRKCLHGGVFRGEKCGRCGEQVL